MIVFGCFSSIKQVIDALCFTITMTLHLHLLSKTQKSPKIKTTICHKFELPFGEGVGLLVGSDDNGINVWYHGSY